MSATGSKTVPSEDELGEKWDRCIADSILKTGTGFGLGLFFSLLIFKRRPWPVALGTGFGLGYAVSNCQHDFRRVPTVHMRPIKVKASSVAVPKPSPDTTQTPATPAGVSPPEATSVDVKVVSGSSTGDTPTTPPSTSTSNSTKSSS